MEKSSMVIQDLLTYEMPYGKYKGYKIARLPESYLVWFRNEGFPKGKLGMLLATMYEIKLNGLEYLLKPLENKKGTNDAEKRSR